MQTMTKELEVYT